MNTLLYHFTSRNRTKLKYVISKIFPRDFNHSIFISHHRLKSLDIINGPLWPASDWREGPTPTWNGIEEVACEFVSEENKFWNIDIFNGRPRGWWRELVLNLWSGPGGLQKDFISLLVVSNCASSSVFWSMRRLFLLLFDNNFGKYHGKGRHIWLTMGASSFRPKCRIHEQEFDNKFRVLNRNPPVHKYVHIGRLRGWSLQ